MDFEPESKHARLRHIVPGTSVEQVQAKTGFTLRVAEDVGPLPEPTDVELRILRERVDPKGVLRQPGRSVQPGRLH